MNRPSRPLFCALLLSLLAACGGTQPSDQQDRRSAAADQASAEASAAEDAALTRAAALNTASLAAAEQRAQAAETDAASVDLDTLPPGQPAPKSAYTSGAVARKALAVAITAYRFYNSTTGAHFYTVSQAERDHVRNNLSPPFSYEGEAFRVASTYAPGLSPVHRFYNTRNGVHFYTISEAERAHVVATLPHYTYEGVAYHASEVAGAHLLPFYRFFVPSQGFHFYTASEAEKNRVIRELGATYRYEGVGYHVLDTQWNAEKLPHTGVSPQNCYRAGSNLLQDCNTDETLALNAWQDGFIAFHQLGRMAYAAVPHAAGSFLQTECRLDAVTGLVWEGKEFLAPHPRAKDRLYSHRGSGESTDVSGHVAAVNASNLCGFSDWRVPSRMELLSLVNYGDQELISEEGFGFYSRSPYWSSETNSLDGNRAWTVEFNDAGGWSLTVDRNEMHAVRLVRGAPLTGGARRFSYTTIAYPGDAANNVVNDHRTGLQWRRCEEGRSWTGTTCTGNGTAMSHEAMLYHAKDLRGWRVPNVKELASLTDLRTRDGARIDPVAFPGASVENPLWSTTPYFSDTGFAWIVLFSSGAVDGLPRDIAAGVRLVRVNYAIVD